VDWRREVWCGLAQGNADVESSISEVVLVDATAELSRQVEKGEGGRLAHSLLFVIIRRNNAYRCRKIESLRGTKVAQMSEYKSQAV
jgi:hypothetical protein